MKFTIVVVPDSNADHEAYLALAVERRVHNTRLHPAAATSETRSGRG